MHQLRGGGGIKIYICYLIATVFTRKGQKTPLPVPLQLHLSKKNPKPS